MKKVLICMPSYDGAIESEMVGFLISMFTSKMYQDIKLSWYCPTGLVVHRARNQSINLAINEGFDYILFLDSDNPPENIDFLKKLMEADKDVVSGLVRMRKAPNPLCIFYKERDINGNIIYEPYQSFNNQNGEIVSIDTCGCGCVLIKRNIFETLYYEYGKSPFESKKVRYRKDDNGEGHKEIDEDEIIETGKEYRKEVSEDLLFFERAKSIGFDIFAHLGVKCYHFGLKPRITVGDIYNIKDNNVEDKTNLGQ